MTWLSRVCHTKGGEGLVGGGGGGGGGGVSTIDISITSLQIY